MVSKDEKTVVFDKDDEQALLRRKSKRKNGMVYAHNGDVSGFFNLEEVHLDSQGKTLGEFLKEIEKFKMDQLQKNAKIKKALKHVLEENKKMKGWAKKYGMVD